MTITGNSAMIGAGIPRMNDILVESQKMIYAPPSREKSKQTMRSPMIDKNLINTSQISNNQLNY